MSRSFNLKGKMVREPPCSMFWNSFSVNMFTESWNAASTSWLRWKVVCQRHCLHKKVSKPYSLPTKIFTHIGSIWMRVVVPWVLRAINHIQGKQMASSYPCTIYVVTLLFTQTVSSQLANGPTRRCIKSSRNVGELVLNPIQLIRS